MIQKLYQILGFTGNGESITSSFFFFFLFITLLLVRLDNVNFITEFFKLPDDWNAFLLADFSCKL